MRTVSFNAEGAEGQPSDDGSPGSRALRSPSEAWFEVKPRAARARRRSTVRSSRRGSALSAFTDEDISGFVLGSVLRDDVPPPPPVNASESLSAAAHCLASAESVLVVVGSDCSVRRGGDSFTSPASFHRHHPAMAQYRCSTAQQALGVLDSGRVTDEVRWGFFLGLARHVTDTRRPHTFVQQRLSSLVKGKDHFVLPVSATSGFLSPDCGISADRVHPINGDWSKYQCALPCRRSAMWDVGPVADSLLPLLSPRSGALPPGSAPRCKECGGPVVPAVRDSTFPGYNPHPHRATLSALISWVERQQLERRRTCVLECCAREPSVRVLCEAVARAVRGCSLVRIDPCDAAVPDDIPLGLCVARGFDVLSELAGPADEDDRVTRQRVAEKVEAKRKRAAQVSASEKPKLTDWRALALGFGCAAPADCDL
eukprot:TRINITY_DN44091_c0_g1_i1.p1 TRINITY_DN44091_c0_g1~~TRINITY_DN44091_c0_g1_i1.p1  ORF type:complete len:446 (+),score=112.53 TRINITY_DN44091_c0_g1_i1:59-1339(+)